MEKTMDWEQKTVLNELSEGRQLANMFRKHPNPYSSPETRLLLDKILCSFQKALSMLSRSSLPAPTISNLFDTGVDFLHEDISNIPKVAMPMRSSPLSPVVGLVSGVDFLQESASNIPHMSPVRSSLPASASGHSLTLNIKGSLNTAEPRDGDQVGTHEQGVSKKNAFFGPNLDIDPQMLKADGDISTLPRTNKRKFVSKVWEHFTKFDKNGEQRAKCKHCNKDFPGSSKSGTTHLKNHLDRCPSKKSKNHDRQLNFAAQSIDLPTEGAQEGNLIFDQKRSCLALAKMIVKNPYLLDTVEDESFKEFLNSLQPMFELQSREVILSDICSIYKQEKEKLHQYLDQLACNFNLTIGLWKDDNLRENAYCYLMAHFIDDDWKLKKTILGFKTLGSRNDIQTLSEIIGSSFSEWKMSNKVCSVTVDNLSMDDDIVEQIKGNYLTGKGFLPSGGCYISSTLVQAALGEIDVSKTPIGKFHDLVDPEKLQGGESSDDRPLWLSKILNMLDCALESREVYFELEKNDNIFKMNPSKEEWDEALAMRNCQKFYLDTSSSFKNQTLTSNLYFSKLCDMYKRFLLLGSSNYPSVKLLKMKFDDYWRTCNLVFAIAAILDPRLKFKFVEFSYHEIYGNDSNSQLRIFNSILTDVYNEYANECKNPTTNASINGDSSHRTIQSANDSVLESFSRYTSTSNFNGVDSRKSELDYYLEEASLPLNTEKLLEFDTLGWWRMNAVRFPTLGRMARDILAIPMYAFLPDSPFRTAMKSPNNGGLDPEIIEAFICRKDWLEYTPKINNKDNDANMQNEATKMVEKGTCGVQNCERSKSDVEATHSQAKVKASYKMRVNLLPWSFVKLDKERTSSKEINADQTVWSEKDIRAYLVSTFTEDEEKQLRRWTSPQILSRDLAVQDKRINVDAKSLAPLLIIPGYNESRQEYYIDDSVVNAFFELLKRRAESFPNLYVKHYSFDSYIAACLIEKSRTDSQLLDRVKIDELKDAEKKLSWLDSMRSSQMHNNNEKEAISGWFKGSLLPLLGYDNANEWPFQVLTDIPLQENSVDCALFVMKYADCVTHGDSFPFSQRDMAHFRQRTLLDIFEGRICQPNFGTP